MLQRGGRARAVFGYFVDWRSMRLGVCTCLLALAACGGERGTGPTPVESGLRAVEVAAGLSNPLYLTAPTGDARLFIVEQPGRIRIVRNGALQVRPFLDITAAVGSGGERGLLGLAFDPAYASNGRFYVHYTDRNGDTRVERYRVSADADVAAGATAELILQVDQPFANHNGGQIAFGPDGMLYIGLGDGGSGGDPQNHGQNPGTLLGTLLRLDVRGAAPYAIPQDNPFRGQQGARPEVWAYGLRNPWRFSFDEPGGTLWIADVGQSQREEVNARPLGEAGLNYGWNRMEGRQCYQPGCSTSDLVLPVYEYSHADGCSVTGGYVYRGAALAALEGHYFFGDYCGGWVRSLRLTGGAVADEREWDLGPLGQILSFGRDSSGELYVLSANGRVYRLEART